jgi:hypothetical protein
MLSHAPLLLHQLRDGLPGVSPVVAGAHLEACIVCLDNEGHQSGVTLHVEGIIPQQEVAVQWDVSVTDQVRRAWADEVNATEWGACALAFALITTLTPYTVIRQSRRGTGIDYWLGRQDSVQLLFQDAARLEVSGIRRADPGTVRTRMRQKKQQAGKAALPTYIVVVEFSGPSARIEEV